MKYSSEAVAFETWDWGDFGKTVGVSAAMGAVSGGLAYGIGEVGSALASGGMGEVGVGIITTSLHMGTQGGLSVAMGGDFWSAALAAGVGHLGGMAMSKAGLGKFGQAAGASVLSGTTSVISGGSFVEGAVTGLIVLMCNQWMHDDVPSYGELEKLRDVMSPQDKSLLFEMLDKIDESGNYAGKIEDIDAILKKYTGKFSSVKGYKMVRKSLKSLNRAGAIAKFTSNTRDFYSGHIGVDEYAYKASKQGIIFAAGMLTGGPWGAYAAEIGFGITENLLIPTALETSLRIINNIRYKSLGGW